MFPRPPLSIAMHGLERAPADPMPPRAAIEWAASLSFRAIQLDAVAPDLRPRTLDRSARRDLAATLRRAALSCSGLDLWIPPEHLADSARSQRAHDTITQAIDLAADLSALGASAGPVSLTLPPACPREILISLGEHSARRGIHLADHAVTPDASRTARRDELATAGLFLGIDPAAVLLAQQAPITVAAGAGDRLAAARLSDASLTARIAPGTRDGRLDIEAYLAAVAIAGYTRSVVLDLRGITDQPAAASNVLDSWT